MKKEILRNIMVYLAMVCGVHSVAFANDHCSYDPPQFRVGNGRNCVSQSSVDISDAKVTLRNNGSALQVPRPRDAVPFEMEMMTLRYHSPQKYKIVLPGARFAFSARPTAPIYQGNILKLTEQLGVIVKINEKLITKATVLGSDSTISKEEVLFPITAEITPVLLTSSNVIPRGRHKVAYVYISEAKDNRGRNQQWRFKDPDRGTGFYLYLDIPQNIPVESYSCRISGVANQTLQLATVGSRKLQAGAEVYGGSTKLRLDCPQAVRAYVTFTDSKNNTNRSNLLTVDEASSGSAKGVALKLYANGSTEAIRYGADSPLKGNENQFAIDERGVPSPILNLDAYYVKKGSSRVEAGRVQAVTTFTFSYQ